MQHIAIYRLRSKHQQLESELRRVQSRLGPDHEQVRALKRRKLAIKDEIARLEIAAYGRTETYGGPAWTS